MKLTIDTKEDSKEDILKAAEFLKSIANNTNTTSKEHKEVSTEAASSFSNMFSDNTTTDNITEEGSKENSEDIDNNNHNIKIEPY